MRLILDAFTAKITIRLSPRQSTDAITYADRDGVPHRIDAGAYKVFGLGCADGARGCPVHGASEHTIRSQPDPVATTFTACADDNPANVPEPSHTAIKIRDGHLCQNRESVVIGTRYGTETHEGPEGFVHNFPTWTL